MSYISMQFESHMDQKVWMIFGGVGLFLTGMYLMEGALSHLASRNFKLLLRRNTSTNARAVSTGIITTALLQSSSIVSFLTLAFASSGIIRLQNALAVILGANIGTTLSNWVIATVGFSFSIDMIWYPVLGIAGLCLVVFRHDRKAEQICFFLLGLTFLFIALGLMKNGMLDTVQRFDFAAFSQYPPFVFVLIGFVITFLIQSSNATMAITLSALFAKAIPFDLAVAVVIGSELGTSLKLVLAAAGSSPEKKRVAAGNILLNLVTTIIAFVFMYPLIRLINDGLGVRDPLQALVGFQMAINIAATLAFFPFLSHISRYLEKYFGENGHRATLYTDERIPSLPGLAEEIFRLEVFYFMKRVLAYNAAEFRLSGSDLGLEGIFTEKEWKKENARSSLAERYDEIKRAQGEIIEYYVHLQKRLSDPAQLSRVNRYMRAVQNAMHAAKGFKDIRHNSNELLQSGNDLKFGQFSMFSKVIQENLRELAGSLNGIGQDVAERSLQGLLEKNEADYADMLQRIYSEAGKHALPEKDISTLQNMNREIYSANRAMIHALGDFLLDGPASETLTDPPPRER